MITHDQRMEVIALAHRDFSAALAMLHSDEYQKLTRSQLQELRTHLNCANTRLQFLIESLEKQL